MDMDSSSDGKHDAAASAKHNVVNGLHGNLHHADANTITGAVIKNHVQAANETHKSANIVDDHQPPQGKPRAAVHSGHQQVFPSRAAPTLPQPVMVQPRPYDEGVQAFRLLPAFSGVVTDDVNNAHLYMTEEQWVRAYCSRSLIPGSRWAYTRGVNGRVADKILAVYVGNDIPESMEVDARSPTPAMVDQPMADDAEARHAAKRERRAAERARRASEAKAVHRAERKAHKKAARAAERRITADKQRSSSRSTAPHGYSQGARPEELKAKIINARRADFINKLSTAAREHRDLAVRGGKRDAQLYPADTNLLDFQQNAYDSRFPSNQGPWEAWSLSAARVHPTVPGGYCGRSPANTPEPAGSGKGDGGGGSSSSSSDGSSRRSPPGGSPSDAYSSSSSGSDGRLRRKKDKRRGRHKSSHHPNKEVRLKCKIKAPPEFSGTNAKLPIHVWLRTVAQYLHGHRESPTRWVEVAESYLIGAAREQWDLFRPDDPTWDAFSNFLQGAFGNAHEKQEIRTRLSTLSITGVVNSDAVARLTRTHNVVVGQLGRLRGDPLTYNEALDSFIQALERSGANAHFVLANLQTHLGLHPEINTMPDVYKLAILLASNPTQNRAPGSGSGGGGSYAKRQRSRSPDHRGGGRPRFSKSSDYAGGFRNGAGGKDRGNNGRFNNGNRDGRNRNGGNGGGYGNGGGRDRSSGGRDQSGRGNNVAAAPWYEQPVHTPGGHINLRCLPFKLRKERDSAGRCPWCDKPGHGADSCKQDKPTGRPNRPAGH
jgi:hypothetical protein